jgi:hypothetical protein
MLEGCSDVQFLEVTCSYNWQCTAVAALLREELSVMAWNSGDEDLSNFNQDEAVRNIAASLRDNTHLKDLTLIDMDKTSLNHFDELLCDTSSIESIYNSNHTLEVISHDDQLGHNLEQCLLLNRNPDKTKVIRDKILRFYCVGEFAVSPFSCMAVSVLPGVLSQFGRNDKLSAIYRLLQCLPDLCNVSDRESCEHMTASG